MVKKKKKLWLDEDLIKYVSYDDLETLDDTMATQEDLDKFLTLRQESSLATLLHFATEEGAIKCANRLIEYGADVNAIDKDGTSPLILCAKIGYPVHTAIAKKLLAEEDIDVRIMNDKFETALGLSVKFERYKLADLITEANKGADLNFPGKNGNTLLIESAFDNNVEKTKFLLLRKVDVNIKNMNGDTAFSIACKYHNLEVMKLLLDAEVDINTSDCFGRTILMSTIMSGHIEVIKELLELENITLSLNKQDNWGYSALMFSVKNPQLNELSEKMIEMGADVLCRDRHDNTATILSAMKHNYDMTFKLCDAGSDCSIANDNGDTVWDLIEDDESKFFLRKREKARPRAAEPQRSDYKWEQPRIEDIEIEQWRKPPERQAPVVDEEEEEEEDDTKSLNSKGSKGSKGSTSKAPPSPDKDSNDDPISPFKSPGEKFKDYDNKE